MSSQTKRTADLTSLELADYADEHLLHEVQMFVGARNALPSVQGQFMKNAMIEVCVLHLRNLVDFFYPRGQSHADDVLASHYCTRNLLAITPMLEEARKRAHKELAHLTLDRQAGTPPSKQWDFAALSNDLRLVVKDFITCADPQKLRCRCKDQLREI